MTVFVNRTLIADGIPRDLHLLDARCRGVEYDDNFVEMQTMYDLCGTTVEVSTIVTYTLVFLL